MEIHRLHLWSTTRSTSVSLDWRCWRRTSSRRSLRGGRTRRCCWRAWSDRCRRAGRSSGDIRSLRRRRGRDPVWVWHGQSRSPPTSSSGSASGTSRRFSRNMPARTPSCGASSSSPCPRSRAATSSPSRWRSASTQSDVHARSSTGRRRGSWRRRSTISGPRSPGPWRSGMLAWRRSACGTSSASPTPCWRGSMAARKPPSRRSKRRSKTSGGSGPRPRHGSLRRWRVGSLPRCKAIAAIWSSTSCRQWRRRWVRTVAPS